MSFTPYETVNRIEAVSADEHCKRPEAPGASWHRSCNGTPLGATLDEAGRRPASGRAWRLGRELECLTVRHTPGVGLSRLDDCD